MNNISSSISTSLSNELPHLYSGLSGTSSSLSTSSSTNSEQKTQLEKNFTIKNRDDLEEAFARIPREVLQGGNTPRHISFCSRQRVIFSDGKELSGKFITNGNTIVDRNQPSFFNSNLHKKFQPLAESQIGLRSEFEAVTIEPINKSDSVYLIMNTDSVYSNVKITIWDLSSSKAKEKESWVVNLEDLIFRIYHNITDIKTTHFNISEDGNWLLVTVSQKDPGKNKYFYSIADKKFLKRLNEDLEITTEYFLPEGYLVTGRNQTNQAMCRFIPINAEWKSWSYPGTNVLDYNKERVLIRGQDALNQKSLVTVNLRNSQLVPFENSAEAKLCDNFVITLGSRNCTIKDIRPFEKFYHDNKNFTDQDVRATWNYSVVPHFSESAIFLDVLIKANKINIFFEERANQYLAHFEFTPLKKARLADTPQVTLFGNNKILLEIAKTIFKYLNSVDLNVTIGVSRGWRELTKLTALTRLHSFINIPGRNALIYNRSLGHSYDSSSFAPTIRGPDHVFLPTAALSDQEEIRRKIAGWKVLARGEKYAFAGTSESDAIAVFDMDSQEIRYLHLGTGNDVAGILPTGREGFVTITHSGSLTQWSINSTQWLNHTNAPIFEASNQSQFSLNKDESILNFFSSEKNKYVLVTYIESTDQYFVSTFHLEKGTISTEKRHEFPVSSIDEPSGFDQDEEMDRDYTFFYQNGLLFFTWQNFDDTPGLNLTAFSIRSDKLELVWSKECYQNSNFETPPQIILHNHDYIVISGRPFNTAPHVDGFVLRPLTVLETKEGETVLTLWIDQEADQRHQAFTALISNDLLAVQGTSSLDSANTINLYHLTTGQFLGHVPMSNKDIRDMKLLDSPHGPCLRFLCCELVDESEEEDDESQEVVDLIDIWVADILLKSPKDIIATIPQNPGNFPKTSDLELFTEDLDLEEELRTKQVQEKPTHRNDMEVEEEKKEQS